MPASNTPPNSMSWDELATDYDSLYRDAYSQYEDEVLGAALNAFSPSGKILDICCGTGLAYDLLKQPEQYTGIDNSQGMLYEAYNKYPRANWHLDDIRSLLTIDTHSIDTVIGLHGSLSYAGQWHLAAWANILRVLKPDGRFFIGVYGQYPLWRISQGFSRHAVYHLRQKNAVVDKVFNFSPSYLKWVTGAKRIWGISTMAKLLENKHGIRIDKLLCGIPHLCHILIAEGTVSKTDA